MRTISSTLQTQLDTGVLHTAHLVSLSLSDSEQNSEFTTHITDYHVPVNHDGNNFTALGHLLLIDNAEDTKDLQINQVSIQLSGVDAVHIANVLSYDYVDRDLKIYRAFLDDNDAVIEAHQIFAGRITQPSIQENYSNQTCTVGIRASSYLADFDKRSHRHTNHTEQQAHDPTDNFFKQWGQINKEIVWGHVPKG